MNTSMSNKESIVSRWASLRASGLSFEVNEGARLLAVSELELFEAHEGPRVRRLDGRWAELLSELSAVGPCVATTFNAHAEIEQIGTYAGLTVREDLARVHDDDFDLCLNLGRVRVAFLVREPHEGMAHGIHFFDDNGSIAHRVRPRSESQYAVFDELMERHMVASSESLVGEGTRVAICPRADQDVDCGALCSLWATFQDEDALQCVLDGAGIKRHQALRLIGPKWAEPAIAKGSYLEVLRSSAASQLPIRITVRGAAVSQAYVGAVRTARRGEGSVCVLGNGMSLTLHEMGIADSWIVRVPSGSSTATCLELYDHRQDGVLCLRDQGPSWIGAGQWRELLRQSELVVPNVRTCPDQEGGG
jgi:putative heme degradation protein